MTDKQKIRLLIFTPTLKCGGSEKFVSTLCNNIDTEKFSIGLVVLNNESPFYEIKNKAVEVIGLKKQRVLFSLFSIKRVVKNFQPDIIFATANHLNLYFAIFRHSFQQSIKFAARESSIVSINSRRAKMPWVYHRLIKKYYDRFDVIVCQSVYMQQDLITNYNIPAGKTRVIHNPVDILLQDAATIPGQTTPGGVYKFITVTRLSEEKGVERLIHAVGLLSIPFRLFIFGDGEKREALQDLINELQLQDKIILKGGKPDPFKGMEDARLFLMGSYYEGFPNVLLEAGSLGIPVVAFNVPGGIPEIISDEEKGVLVDDNDIIGFAAAIKRSLSLNFDRKRIIETTQKRFSMDIVMPQVEQLFIQLR